MNRSLQIAVALAALASLAAGAAAAQSYDGLYRPDFDWAEGWDCRTVGMDGGALAVRDGRFHGIENICELTSPVEVRGMDGTLYDGVCTGEGETYGERILILRTDVGITVIRPGGRLTPLRRCE